MTVWVSGRTEEEGGGPVPLAGSVSSTAAAVTSAGGHGVARCCDHADDAAVERLFAELLAEEGRLDVVVNAVWGGYERFVGVGPLSFGPFWEQPLSLWDSMQRGVRSAYVASSLAARVMVEQGAGLIVCISSSAGQRYVPREVAYGVAHSAVDRMVADMALELAGTGVTIVSLYPGLVRTENVLANAVHFDLANSESPEFSGRAIAALAHDPAVSRRTGTVLVAAELAAEYGFPDVDGKQPTSLRETTPAD